MKPYYCPKCDRKHYRGKIYKEHKPEQKVDIPMTKFIKYEDNLRLVAKNQLNRLIEKWLVNKESIYVYQINRLLIHEKTR